MEKIEFTNPESKELNEEVRNYLELMRDTEAPVSYTHLTLPTTDVV